MKVGPRVLYLDTENTPKLAAVWKIHDTNVSYPDVFQDFFIISGQWAWGDSDKVNTISVIDKNKDYKNDKVVIQTIVNAINECDILVGHNIKNHDLKNIKARMAKHGISPYKQPVIVDTLELARKFGFTSKKLGDLCKFLDLKNQKDTHEPGAFLRAALGDKDSIRDIVRYGKKDIPTVREVFKVLRPYADNLQMNNNLYRGDGVECCPACGHEEFKKSGYRYTRVGKVQRYKCLSCGKWFDDGKTIKSVKMR